MKKLALFLVILMGIVSFTSCNDDENFDPKTNVPERVKQEFESKYPDVTDVHWDIVKNYYVARFNAAQTRAASAEYNTNVWFTQAGQLCQTDEDIDYEDLPALVKEMFEIYMNEFYFDWKIDECEILAREGMGTIFVIEIENGELEREISISETGDILKDVLDDDDEDEILPVTIPEEVYAALRTIFPDTYVDITILEFETEDEGFEVDIMEGNRHKEIELDALYNLVSMEYEITFAEAQLFMPEIAFQNMMDFLSQAGIDVLDETVLNNMEIKVIESAKGIVYEIEIELNGEELEFEIDEAGNIGVEEE